MALFIALILTKFGPVLCGILQVTLFGPIAATGCIQS